MKPVLRTWQVDMFPITEDIYGTVSRHIETVVLMTKI